MKNNPLYQIPVLAFGLLALPAFTPQAVFADQVWTKITMKASVTETEARFFYSPDALTTVVPEEQGFPLYRAPEVTRLANSTLYGASGIWHVKFPRQGQRPKFIAQKDFDVSTVTIPDKPALPSRPADAIGPIWAYTLSKFKDRSPADQQEIGSILSAAHFGAGDSGELLAYVKSLGANAATTILAAATANDGQPTAAAVALLQMAAQAKPTGAIAGTVKAGTGAFGQLFAAAKRAIDGDIELPVGQPVAAVKNAAAEKIEEPLAEKIKNRDFFAADAAPMAAAFAEFIWETWDWDKKSFISESLRENIQQAATLKSSMVGFVEAWTTAAVMNPERRHSVIIFYMGLGAETSPKWAKGDPVIETILTGEGRSKIPEFANFRESMRACMDKYATGEGAAAAGGSEKCFPGGAGSLKHPFEGSGETEFWVSEFLTKAIGNAVTILAGLSESPEEIAKIIGESSDTEEESASDGGGREGQQRDDRVASDKFFGMKDLFGAFGETVDIPGESEPKPLNNVFRVDGREFALVVRTVVKTVKGKREMTNQVGIYDISDRHDIVGKRFDLSESGEHKLVLPGRDRQYIITIPRDKSKPIGFAAAHLEAKENGKIKIPDVASGERFPNPGGGTKWMASKVVEASAMPSVADLFRARAQKALRSTSKVTLDREMYYVTGEATKTGNLLYWDEKTAKMIAESDTPWKETPKMMSEVSKKGRNGKTEYITNSGMGMAVLGKVPDDSGHWYGLQWKETGPGEGFYVTVRTSKVPTDDVEPEQETGGGDDGEESGGDNQTTPRNSDGSINVASFNQSIKSSNRIGGSDKSRKGDFAFLPRGKALLIEMVTVAGRPVTDHETRTQWTGLTWGTAFNSNDPPVAVAHAQVVNGEGNKRFLFVEDVKGGIIFWDLTQKVDESARTPFSQGKILGKVLDNERNNYIKDKQVLKFLLGRANSFEHQESLGREIRSIAGPNFEKLAFFLPGDAATYKVLSKKDDGGESSCTIKLKDSAWKAQTGVGCQISFGGSSDAEGPAGSFEIGKEADSVSGFKLLTELGGAANATWTQSSKEYKRIVQGSGNFAASGAYVLKENEDARSPAELRIVYAIVEAAEGEHVVAGGHQASFQLKSLNGFGPKGVLGAALSGPLLESYKGNGNGLTAAQLPRGFVVGGIQLPPGFVTTDAFDATKFFPQVVPPRNASGGGIVMIQKGERNNNKCIGVIAVWGSVTLGNACEKSGVAS